MLNWAAVSGPRRMTLRMSALSDIDRSDLSEPMAARDGLFLDGGLPLWFCEDHHGGRLDVQSDAAGLDLARENQRLA